jgi:gliding motility-associated-like protein
MGDIFYFWDFGNGITSFEAEPNIVFNSSGIHPVALEISDSLTGCTHRVVKDVESFSPLTIGYEGYTTYCPGESTWLKGYGASHYNWKDCIDCDSLEISDSGIIWFIGYSSDYLCSTDTIPILITQEPDWDFWIEGDTVLCIGENTELFTYGSDSLLWNDLSQESSLIIYDSGYYFCRGTNSRGCIKYDTIHVMKSPPPNVDFTLSDTIVNSRNYVITATTVDLPNINYIWDMGDGHEHISGSSVTHSYDYNFPGKTYVCTLEATNEFGCKNFAYDEIVVIPFIPNIFTPNGDNLNDKFMIGADIEIFDRHGKRLYRGTDGWNGKFKGQPVDPDTYFYSVTYTFENGKVHIKKGDVVLMR